MTVAFSDRYLEQWYPQKEKAQEQTEMVARENTKAVGGAKLSLVDVTVERVDPVTGKAASSKKKGRKSSRKASGSDTDWGRVCMSGVPLHVM